MEFLNSKYAIIFVIALVLGVCYLMWRELKRTQGEVSGLKNFSGRVASFIESAQVVPPPTSAPPAAKVIDEGEEKKE